MLKNILNLNGAQQLSKKEQLTVNGGKDSNYCKRVPNYTACANTHICCNGICVIDNGPNTCFR